LSGPEEKFFKGKSVTVPKHKEQPGEKKRFEIYNRVIK
jgi:hypothetical protein